MRHFFSVAPPLPRPASRATNESEPVSSVCVQQSEPKFKGGLTEFEVDQRVRIAEEAITNDEGGEEFPLPLSNLGPPTVNPLRNPFS